MAPPVSAPPLLQRFAEAFRIFLDRNLEQHPRGAVRFSLQDDDHILATCDGGYMLGVLRLDPDTMTVLAHYRDPESETPVVSSPDSFAEQAAATLLRTRRIRVDAVEQAFSAAAARIRHDNWLIHWDGSARSANLVAIWNHKVRLPIGVALVNGRLLARPEDDLWDPDTEFWDPIEVVISEFLRRCTTRH